MKYQLRPLVSSDWAVKNYQAKGLSLVEENLKTSKMDVKALITYQKYKDKIVLSESVYETAYTEVVMEGIEQGKIC